MPQDIENSKFRNRLNNLENKTSNVTVSNNTSSFNGDVDITGNLHLISTTSDPVIIQNISDGNFNRILYQKPSRTWSAGQTNGNNFAIADETAGSYRMFIDTDGDVGIGTTSPATNLHVYETANANNGIFVDTSNAGYQTYISFAATGSTVWQFGRQGSGSSHQLFLYDSAGSRDIIRANTGTNGNLLLQPINGNVGIGTTIPTVALHVRNANTTYSDPENNNLPTIFATNTNNASLTAHSILGTRVNGAGGGDPFIAFDIAGVTGWSIGVDNSDNDKFKISNNWSDVGTATDVTIQTNGNVGIGTTAPSLQGSGTGLSIVGNQYIQLQVSGTSAGGIQFNCNGGDQYEIQADNNDAFFIYNRTDGAYRLYIDTAGNVGINTTAPAADLDINNGSLGTTSGNELEALRLTSTVSNASVLRFFTRRHANGTDWFTAATRIQQTIDGGASMGYVEFNHPSNKGGVVIGTDYANNYPLYVNGNYTISATYGYLNSAGSVGTTTDNAAISIRASDRIMATEFNAVSDARNKEIYSDVEINLKEKFKQLNIANFIQKSDLGIKKNKGVIAQEVEKIFPDAVSQTTDYVYDIFCLCEKVVKLNEQDYQITSTKTIDLNSGDEIKIFYKDIIDNVNKEKYLLIKEIINSKTFIVDSGEDITNECVILGRKVDDFRIVNYQYLNSLTTKMVQEIMLENDYLKSKLEEKDKQINDILSRITALENKNV